MRVMDTILSTVLNMSCVQDSKTLQQTLLEGCYTSSQANIKPCRQQTSYYEVQTCRPYYKQAHWPGAADAPLPRPLEKTWDPVDLPQSKLTTPQHTFPPCTTPPCALLLLRAVLLATPMCNAAHSTTCTNDTACKAACVSAAWELHLRQILCSFWVQPLLWFTPRCPSRCCCRLRKLIC